MMANICLLPKSKLQILLFFKLKYLMKMSLSNQCFTVQALGLSCVSFLMHYNELQRLSVKYVFEFMPALKSEVIGINLRSTLCRKGFQQLIQVWLSQCKGMLSYLMKICVIYVKFSSFELIHISTLNMSIQAYSQHV